MILWPERGGMKGRIYLPWIGRMGIPYREKGINIISIAIDAPQDMISALSGKIGRLNGVSTKTAYSNVITKAEEKAE